MGKIISNGIEYVGIVNNFNMDYRAGIQAITSNNGASYNITFDEPLNTVDYNVYLQSVNYSGQGFATMGYAVSNRTINGFTFTVYNTSSFSAHDICWTAIPQNSNGISTNDKINYSTTEQKTGQKWIDGKDIYQKTIVVSEGIVSGVDNSISHNITDIDEVIDYNVIMIETSGYATKMTQPVSVVSTATASVNATYAAYVNFVGKTDILYTMGSVIVNQVSKIVVTIYYTKSTT